ncbi:Putative phoD-like phosphatase, metallophosphatase domain, metallo-dependent phosphatase [Septoria linicola]|uniref:PhoD-like phosphatase, metallophosphatase domain, metallo-dependent phosphatase n=1 Tax=Septoria linicola TaxID=215465 RepID=A0A9Q9EIB6_9PEZI|nr:putative phoD-like phosphatase, metallophosphatase domain, metallo-dependent phosphatase [Septoria linicola]USW50924.1 Putative phoD-like phosphatase, metallophosphatase domain, metallo-dependent phosphatase [Septoria linicola]
MASSWTTHDLTKAATAASSTILRLSAFVFLRWIPGHHFPPLIYTAFATYVTTFWYVFTHTSPWKVIADNIFVTERPVTPEIVLDVDGNELIADEELVVEEEIDLVEKEPRTIRTLLTGLPSPSSTLLSLITFLINVLLLLFTIHLIHGARYLHPAHDLSFARTGYVSDTAAKVLVREPNGNQLPIFGSYRYADAPLHVSKPDTAWKSAGQIDWLDERTDFTGTFSLTGLVPDTRYQWSVSNNNTGFFTTAPKVGQISTRAENQNLFTFVHSSCIKLNFPYSPFNHPLSAPGFQYLADGLRGLKAQFMLFLGDFIYIDVPGGTDYKLEDYRRQYRQVYSSPEWPAASKELPWIHVYDDHEIKNDWDANTTGVFPAANDPYEHYHVAANPPAHRAGETYFSFSQGPATFFMLDTRRYRTPNDKTNGSDPITGEPTKSMLGEQQLADLLAWLRKPEPSGIRWKIVVTSVPFTKNWWANAEDTWRGYLGERQIILEAMWDVGLRGGLGVIILSGDRHEFAATAFPPPPNGKEEIFGLGHIGLGANPLNYARDAAHLPPDQRAALQTRTKRWPLSATVHEFSVSPLNMFYLPIRTYAESSTDEEYVSDVCIKYLPDGNSKFGAVSISNPEKSDQSVLTYRLFVDGVESWSYTLTSPPDVRGGSRSKDAIWG